MMRHLLSIAVLVTGFVLAGPAAQFASACPLCKEANETNPALPRAYMYSILFMLGVPATVLAGFGIGFYRLSRTANKAADAVAFTGNEELGGPPEEK